MAEGGVGFVLSGSPAVQCSPDEEAENMEQQTMEIDMLQSIFEGQIVLLNASTEYLVGLAISCSDMP